MCVYHLLQEERDCDLEYYVEGDILTYNVSFFHPSITNRLNGVEEPGRSRDNRHRGSKWTAACAPFPRWQNILQKQVIGVFAISLQIFFF